MHTSEAADHFQMAQFLGADVHQQVLAVRILAVQSLNRILHRGGKFAVRSAELLEQHIAETNIRLVHADREHQLLDVVIHGRLLAMIWGNTLQKPLFLATLTSVASHETHQQMLENEAGICANSSAATINRVRVVRRAILASTS